MRLDQVAQTVALHNDGRSIRYIEEMLGVPRSTISDALRRFKETGFYSRRKTKGNKRR